MVILSADQVAEGLFGALWVYETATSTTTTTASATAERLFEVLRVYCREMRS